MTITDESKDYTGVDVLEILQDAVNYNAFLLDTVRAHAAGSRRVLDFGAGIGTFAKSLRATGLDVACVEPDAAMAARLERDGFQAFRSVPAERFSMIYTLNVLEHIEDDVGALRALRQSLAPDGTLYIYVPAFASLFSAFDRRVGHLRRYRAKDLGGKVTAAGFVVRSVRYVDSLGYFAALVYRLVADDKGTVSPGSVRIYDRYLFPMSRILDRILGRFVGKNLEIVAAQSQLEPRGL